MVDQNAILDANDVRRNPVHWLAEARKSPVHDHKIFFGHNRSRFVLQRRRDALDELKEAVTTRFDMGAVLDVVGRPIALSRCVVSLIKQRVESFKYKRFIFRFNRLIHCTSPNIYVWRHAAEDQLENLAVSTPSERLARSTRAKARAPLHL